MTGILFYSLTYKLNSFRKLIFFIGISDLFLCASVSIEIFFSPCSSFIERPCEGDKIFATRHFQQLGVKTRSQEWRTEYQGILGNRGVYPWRKSKKIK